MRNTLVVASVATTGITSGVAAIMPCPYNDATGSSSGCHGDRALIGAAIGAGISLLTFGLVALVASSHHDDTGSADDYAGSSTDDSASSSSADDTSSTATDDDNTSATTSDDDGAQSASTTTDDSATSGSGAAAAVSLTPRQAQDPSIAPGCDQQAPPMDDRFWDAYRTTTPGAASQWYQVFSRAAERGYDIDISYGLEHLGSPDRPENATTSVVWVIDNYSCHDMHVTFTWTASADPDPLTKHEFGWHGEDEWHANGGDVVGCTVPARSTCGPPTKACWCTDGIKYAWWYPEDQFSVSLVGSPVIQDQ